MLAGCGRAPQEASPDRASPESVAYSLPNGELSLAIRAVKDAGAVDRLDRAETMLEGLMGRGEALPQGRRAELERIAAMIEAEREIREPLKDE